MNDVVLKGGTIYDGRGGAPVVGDLAIRDDEIVSVGPAADAERVVDARGLAVAPGFINMLSWAAVSLIADGRAQSDIRQGVTLEAFGEGWSLGPLTDAMKRDVVERQGDVKYDVTWTTLAEGLDELVARGVSPNVASLVGAATVRIHELGHADRPPTTAELERMRALVDAAMRDGALGVGSALIYAPATFADTDELTALAEVAARYGGLYTSHIRNESDRLLEAIDELVEIARRAKIRAEIYHLKQAGQRNWSKLEAVIERVERARAEGLTITADMYTYTAGSTGLDASMPPWVQAGGHRAWVERLRDRAVRERVRREMREVSADWDNLYAQAGSPENILLASFHSPALKPYAGKRLSEVAAARGTSPEETAMDLVVEDDSNVGAVYFLMSEENVRKQVALPWMSFGSDAQALAPEGVFLQSKPHPRAYGNVARLLGRYVRDEGLVPLAEAIRRLTSFPAANLGIARRGTLAPSCFADVVAFDAATIRDHATFEDPHRYATGVAHVFVNGVQVLKDGEHTGALPGRVVRRGE